MIVKTKMLSNITKAIADRNSGSLTVLFVLDVLEILSSGTARITEIAKALRSAKSPVFRVMASFALRGYVTQEESRKCRLGPSVGNLAEGYNSTIV